MKVLVLGAGAVGGYFGGRLSEIGADVTFLVRAARAQSIAENGLVIKSPVGDALLRVAVVTEKDPGKAFDLILLTCKSYDLAPAIESIRPHMAAGQGIVLPLLNGMAHIERLRGEFGPDRVLGGACGIFATLGPQGEILHFEKMAWVTIGRFQDQIERRKLALEIDAAVNLFSGVNFTFRRQEPVEQVLWEKWVLLAALAAGTVLMRASVGEILAAPQGEALLLGLLGETVAIASAAGYPPSQQHLDRVHSVLTQRGSQVKASMLRDIERGGRTEGAHIIGDLVARARKHDVKTPLLDIVNAHVRIYDTAQAKTN